MFYSQRFLRCDRPSRPPRVLIAGREGRATASLKELGPNYRTFRNGESAGIRDDVPDLLAAADVFAFPSLWEGAGGTLLESMALECPIVTSALPTLLEAVDESTALLVPKPCTRPRCSHRNCLRDRHAAMRRVVCARRRFEDQFTIESERTTDDWIVRGGGQR